MTEKPYLIGIDASIQDGNNGLAFYDVRAKKYIAIRSMSLESIPGEISDFLTQFGIKSDDGREWTNVAVVIENAELDSNVFKVWEAFQLFLKQMLRGLINWKAIEQRYRSDMQQAQGIGMQKAAARITIKKIKGMGLEVIEVGPSWRERADVMKKKAGLSATDITYYRMPTKTTSAQFQHLTGYTERSNEHGRDAATLLWGQTIERLRIWSSHMVMTAKNVPNKFRKEALEQIDNSKKGKKK